MVASSPGVFFLNIVFLKLFLINLRLEKLLSALAELNGTVIKIRREISVLGNVSGDFFCKESACMTFVI